VFILLHMNHRSYDSGFARNYHIKLPFRDTRVFIRNVQLQDSNPSFVIK